MDYSQMERHQAQLRRDQKWEEAYDFLVPFLGGSRDDQAFGRILGALTRYEQAPLDIRECLEETDVALQIAVSREMIVRGCINGLLYARFASDQRRAAKYIALIKELVPSTDPCVSQWIGRGYMAIASYHAGAGETKKALRYWSKAFRWHQVNAGPYGESDCKCMLGLCAGGIGEALLTTGQGSSAKRFVRAAANLLEGTARPGIAQYLRGLYAATVGKPERAVAHYTIALSEAKSAGAHELRYKVITGMALAMITLKEYDKVRIFIDEARQECKQARLLSSLQRLQSIAAMLPARGGNVS